MTGTPRISVVMSCYNDAPYLAEAIKSILDETFADFEFIILDDGSTDATRDIVRSYDAPRIRLIVDDGVPQNLGLAARLNQGLTPAREERVASMDGDDVAMLHGQATQHAWLERNAATLVSSWIAIINIFGRPEIVAEALLRLRRHDKSISASGLANLEVHVFMAATVRAEGRHVSVTNLRSTPSPAASAYARCLMAKSLRQAQVDLASPSPLRPPEPR